MMQDVIEARKKVYRFLYRERIENPTAAFERHELDCVETKLADAALSLGLELGHVERVRGRYFRMTAAGMLYAEGQRWVEEEA